MNNKREQPTPPMMIRQASAQDDIAIRTLRLEALRLHPTAFTADLAMNERETIQVWRERLETMSSGDDESLFMAAIQTDVIGMAGIHRGNRPKTRHNATIWGVYVREQWRGRRVAEGLVMACLDWARGQHLRLVKLEVNAENTAAIRCYQRCGFKEYGLDPQVIHWQGQYYDEIMMVKQVG